MSMRKLISQQLMLSGFYFIIAFVLSTWKNDFTYYAALLAFGLFVLLFVVLCVKKSFSFLEKFDNNNYKTANYLKAVGLAQYYNIIFGVIPGFFIDEGAPVPTYFRYAATGYFVLLFVALAYATYVNCPKCKCCKAKVVKCEPVAEVKEVASEQTKTATKKTAAKKPAAKKTATKNPAAKKTTAKKPVAKK